MPAARKPGGLWGHADFLRLWAAQAASAFGSRITRTALPMIAILSIDATPAQIAVLSALTVAPAILVAPLAGGWVDRCAKRPLLIGSDLARALLIVTIPLAAWLGVLTMPQLYVVAAAVGAATTLFQIADNSYLPSLVGPEQLVQANARLEATESVAEAGGPALAGLLVQILSAPFAVIVDAATYLWSAVWLSRICSVEGRAVVQASSHGVVRDMREGLRACLGSPALARVLLADAVMYFFGGFFLALYMVAALDVLELAPGTVGLVIGLGGVGAFVGAWLAAPLARAAGTGRAMVLSLAVGQAANLLVALALTGGPFAIGLLVLQQVVGDAFLAAYLVHAISLRQRALPAPMLGRANATFHLVTGAMLPAGALVAGLLAGALGVPTTLWIAAIGGLLAAPILWAPAFVRMR